MKYIKNRFLNNIFLELPSCLFRFKNTLTLLLTQPTTFISHSLLLNDSKQVKYINEAHLKQQHSTKSCNQKSFWANQNIQVELDTELPLTINAAKWSPGGCSHIKSMLITTAELLHLYG